MKPLQHQIDFSDGSGFPLHYEGFCLVPALQSLNKL